MQNTRAVTAPVIIDQAPALKSFALADVLSLATGLRLPGADVHGLAGFIAGVEPCPAHTALYGRDARECLEAQLGFLKFIDTAPLLSGFRRGHGDAAAEIWLAGMKKNFGAEHFVMPRERWARRKGSHRL